ncbi:mannose-ethanolamine phosphotransferase gpi13 [Sporothrix eucalyptigena]|uniref:Mannose-ethanolamine phosphotransferase gpi13 n=1 Tax=Sporothrix eucalyptigena TaxID=1812306 RepID=A0ABP0BM37_9PEZI
MAPSTPRKKGSASAPTPNPEYQSIAKQFAAANRIKQIEDAARAGRADANAEHKRATALERRRALREAAQKSAYESRWLWTVAFWLWLLAVHAAGIYYFTSGFLLTRLVLDEQSSCAVSPLAAASSSNHVSDPATGCWHPKTFDRAVIVLIDALRYDFTVPVGSAGNDTQAELFHNAFPFLYETAVNNPTHAFLRPFIADPPTTTLQRLKGLTTGTLPTFMDMGSNFAGTAVEEDNLLQQLRNLGKTIVHLGDDTWTALFPGYFAPNVSHAYDSFNVWDLHTVDNGVLEHIFPLMDSEVQKENPWDVLIGHCLGVDHAGHRYGPSHPAMREKLQQMDDFIRRMVATIDDNTLLVVMGDHGMDSKGDHGGESDDEVEAALWMYARRPLFGRTHPDFVIPPATAKERPVNQIDLVPTLALLLGIPIPYNNLGWPIEEAFVGPQGDNWANLATVGELTAAGIHRYQTSYATAQGIESTDTSVPPPPSVSNASKKQAKADAYTSLAAYQAETLRSCKELWANFDVPSMVLGIAIMASGVVALLLYATRRGDAGDDDDEGVALIENAELDHAEMLLELQGELVDGENLTSKNKDDDSDMYQVQNQHRSLVLGGLIGAIPVLSSSIAWASVVKEGTEPWYVFAGYSALTSTLVVSAQLLGRVGRRRLWRLLPSSIWGWMAFVFTVAQSVGFASNSYTIWEDNILLFFLATFGFVSALASLRLTKPGDRALGIYHAVVFVLLGRLASLSKLCREEQMPYCTSTYYASANSSTSAIWQLAIPFTVFLIMPTIVRSFFEPTRSYEGLAPTWIGYVFRGGLFMAAVYWTLDAADNGNWWADTVPAGTFKTASVYVAQTVLGLALVAGTVAFVWAGPCVSFSARAVSGSNRAQVAVLGYANAHGARYLLLVVNLLIAGVQLSKPMGGGALALMLWQILSLLELLDLLKTSVPEIFEADESSAPSDRGTNVSTGNRSLLASIEEEEETTSATINGTTVPTAPDTSISAETTANSTATPSSIAVIGPVILAMLANFHYFTTGHQASLSSIQWDSAFIPLFTVRYPWSPLVIAANTFPGHLIAVAAVPLLVLWKTGPRRRGGLLSPTSRALAGFAAYFAVEALATMAWAGHLRRHLMLYRVFNPRFMMAAAALLIVDIATIVLALIGLRSNTLAVSEVFGWVEDY